MSTQDAPAPLVPQVPGAAPHILLVRAPYYRDVVDGMTVGATGILQAAGASFVSQDVAGAFELPQAIRLALRGRTRFDGYVALGCILRGETDHYDHICTQTMAGLMQVALGYGIALGSGLLTVHHIDQAIARSSADGHNKGAEAAIACLRQIAFGRESGAF